MAISTRSVTREIGLNLTSLTESMSTAIEPMKAVGELVPVIDQLVAAIEAREAGRADEITADQLVTNLADQLAVGAIDPWTFKCAYMAVFPEDHPADLLRRLVELLGTQRLSGDLFRAAYEAVQAASPPTSYASPVPPHQVRQVIASAEEDLVGAIAGEEIRAEMSALHDANDELRRAMEEREDEFEQLLNAKEQELKEVHEQLAVRYEEFNERYAELTNALKKREEEYQALLANKDVALSEKESETSLLRGQIEELRMQFEEFGRETRKQRSEIKQAVEDAKQAQPVNKPAEYASFFDTAPTRPPQGSEFRHPVEEQPVPEKPELLGSPQPQAPQPQPEPQSQFQAPQAPISAPSEPAQQATFAGGAQDRQRPATAGFSSGSGSYGSGVRAQVFEVIVRQALAGAPWREICASPMQVNNISPEEVEAEVKRRQSMLGK